LLADYLVTGGFPEALSDFLRTQAVTEPTIRVLWETAAGDLSRWGRDRMTAFGLLDRIVRSAGSPVSWNSLAEDIDVASYKTAQEYVQLLADAFLLLQIHHWDTGRGRISPKKQKKIYPADPLLAFIPSLLRPGAAAPEVPRMIESLVAMTLFRTEETAPVEAMGLPRALHYSRNAAGNEIDFLVRSAGASLPVEVAWGEPPRKGKTIESIKRRFGRGILVTRSTFEPDADVRQVPASLFCALLDTPV
jgi:predicted AAA+ superfamily ATPase